jgi:hypothetical protein
MPVPNSASTKCRRFGCGVVCDTSISCVMQKLGPQARTYLLCARRAAYHVSLCPPAHSRSLPRQSSVICVARHKYDAEPPHSPWQRGTSETPTACCGQYLPKRTDLSGYTQSQFDKIALRLNQRPRKILGFQTPASKLRASVAPTL